MNEASDLTDAPERPQSNMTGVVGLVLSCIGLFFCIFALPGLIVSIIGLRKEPKTAALVGVIIGSIGMLMSVLLIPLLIGLMLPALDDAREQARIASETSNINRIHKALNDYAASDEHAENQAAGNPHAAWDGDNVRKKYGPDSWGTPYRVEGDGTTVPRINSAGPDGVHDTKDDITPMPTSTKND